MNDGTLSGEALPAAGRRVLHAPVSVGFLRLQAAFEIDAPGRGKKGCQGIGPHRVGKQACETEVAALVELQKVAVSGFLGPIHQPGLHVLHGPRLLALHRLHQSGFPRLEKGEGRRHATKRHETGDGEISNQFETDLHGGCAEDWSRVNWMIRGLAGCFCSLMEGELIHRAIERRRIVRIELKSTNTTPAVFCESWDLSKWCALNLFSTALAAVQR
ncbi:hypothetical protein [Hydrogenophaga sp.]|uniref:hypothetical protein n=1 Tax=Hydrogenophaga sp. TaxID=1904254 RepID=UPI00272F1713|nr:hypothetical protein [Hydrogenophaga sp.]MDP1685270.1 hypothetical protein [Hydrogenophaga sp.]